MELGADIVVRVIIFVISLLCIHFGLDVVWGWSIFWAALLAVLGYVLIVIVLDGDGSPW